MKVLVVGNGAREHAIAWKLIQSPKLSKLYVAPGNAGTSSVAENIAIKADDTDSLLRFASDNNIDLTVVGPEGPLAAGIVDKFKTAGLRVFGPSKAAAEIESSKVFSKSLMQQHGIPTAGSASFSHYDEALDYLHKHKTPVVLKADGLAAGKGVIIVHTTAEAEQALASMMKEKTFGTAGDQVVIEDYLEGREMSFFVFTDGTNVVPTVPACDYKRVFDGNEGPNTGGMGSYSPPPFYTPALGKVIMSTVMEPTVMAMADAGRPYLGVLYGGLMLTGNTPNVIEFNARLGDPETQVVLPRLKTDLVDIIEASIDNELGTINLDWTDDACVGVVLASGGYPGSYQTGFPVNGLNDVDKDIIIFHAGTQTGPSGEVLTAGGRVLTVVGLGKTLTEAREKVYRNLTRIKFKDVYYRRDIADL